MIWATANSNLALVKYWGKACENDNQPASTSLSVTLDGLTSLAGVAPRTGGEVDRVTWLPPGPTEAVTRFVAEARDELGIRSPLDVVLISNFPVAAGLASSASAYAALATALATSSPEPPPVGRVAAIARRGSGSACRSLFAGFVEWRPGDDADSVTQVVPADHWPLAILVAVTRETPKRIGSREGMRRTAATSPFFGEWLSASAKDLEIVREALRSRDLAMLGAAAERNALCMHAAALASDPPLLYWEAATIAVMREVWAFRENGVAAYFSIDAGPQVKVICEPRDADRVARGLAAVPGVSRVLRSRPGEAPRVLAEPPAWAGAALAARGSVAEGAVA